MPNIGRIATICILVLNVPTPIVLAVPVTVPGLSAPNVPDTPLQKGLKEGYSALAAKQLDKATEAFRQAAKIDPKSAEPLLGLAEVAKLKNDAAGAEEWIRKALTAQPKSAQAHLALARLRYATKKYAEAEDAFKKALALDPKFFAAYVDLGGLYLNALKKPKESAESFKRATEIDPKHAGAQHGLGMSLAALGQVEPAGAAFERAIALAPDMPLPYQALARLHAGKGDYAKGIEILSRLMQSAPKYVPAMIDRGDLYFARKDWTRAAADYSEAAKQAPKNPQAHFKLGLAHQSINKPTDAIRAYRAAIAADPKFIAPYNNLAVLLSERKESLDEALKLSRRAIELDGSVGLLYATLGQVHRARDEKPAAIEAFKKAVSIDPKQPVFRYRLGIALAENGNKKEALASFNEALGLRKDFAEAAEATRWVKKLGG